MRNRLHTRAGCVALALGASLLLAVGAGQADPLDVPEGTELPAAAPVADPLFDDIFDEDFDAPDPMTDADPFESTNRRVFYFNQQVQTYFVDPVTRGYRFLVPGPARRGIRRAVLNLHSPKTLVNDLLQLRFVDAAETLGRFVLNSTLGVGGLLDPAIEAGWERHESDFGQTLATYGVGAGSYLMVPVFGPTTVRDGFGTVVDLAFQPLTYILGPTDVLLQVYIGSGTGLTAIDDVHDELEALEGSSVDYYAALRSAYLQSRRAAVEGLPPVDATGHLGPSDARTAPAR
ncbi:MAG: VacJ family lipoprotein [Myxococcota bacterium]